jgi:hypothetical protein
VIPGTRLGLESLAKCHRLIWFEGAIDDRALSNYGTRPDYGAGFEGTIRLSPKHAANFAATHWTCGLSNMSP